MKENRSLTSVSDQPTHPKLAWIRANDNPINSTSSYHKTSPIQVSWLIQVVTINGNFFHITWRRPIACYRQRESV